MKNCLQHSFFMPHPIPSTHFETPLEFKQLETVDQMHNFVAISSNYSDIPPLPEHLILIRFQVAFLW